MLYFSVFMITLMPYLINAWNKNKPAATTALNTSNPEILANWAALETAIGQDHEFSTGGSNSGKHTQVTFDDPLASKIRFYYEIFLALIFLIGKFGKSESAESGQLQRFWTHPSESTPLLSDVSFSHFPMDVLSLVGKRLPSESNRKVLEAKYINISL